MNIFVLHRNPKKCVQMHCDKHVCKMIIETAQMLSTAKQLSEKRLIKYLYKPTHINHPCSKWARENIKNYNWLCDLGIELCFEYMRRYRKVHKSSTIIGDCALFPPKLKHSLFKTRFPQAMPKQYKSFSAVKAYRKYYLGEKMHFAKWTRRTKPRWVK